MTIEGALTWRARGELRTDVCVIGSGAAGITIARQLDGSALDVVVLEAGGLERAPDVEADTFAFETAGLPFRDDIEARGRWFGGSTNLWFGRIALPDRIDLAVRPWVARSGWPLSYDELAAHFPAAAAILAVENPELLDAGRWPPEPTIETFSPDGRGGIEVFLWAGGMYMGPVARPQLERSTNVRVLTEATAVELVATPDGRSVESVAVVDPNGQRTTVRATTFVLAAGGLENPRLLLASPGPDGRGIGNGRDMVGRCYLDHPRAEGYARVDLRRLTNRQLDQVRLLGEKSDGPIGHVQLRVTFPADLQRREELLNHSLHAHLATDLSLSPAGGRARDRRDQLRAGGRPSLRDLGGDVAAVARSVPQLARAAGRRLRRGAQPAELVVVDQMEHEPDLDSRVTLVPGDRDRFGLPRLRVDWRVGPSTFRSQRRMHELVRDRLLAAGITTFESELLADPDRAVDRLLDMRHPSGTTRMSADPTDGVVDADCRVHGIDNLYVMGSSVFPTVGHFNPTFTIVALAVRLSQRLLAR